MPEQQVQQQPPQLDELADVMARMAGLATPERLKENPGVAVAISRAIAMLEDDGAAEIPDWLALQLETVPEPADRLRIVVRLFGAIDRASVAAIALGLLNKGLLKTPDAA